jgi:hypothetical protein
MQEYPISEFNKQWSMCHVYDPDDTTFCGITISKKSDNANKLKIRIGYHDSDRMIFHVKLMSSISYFTNIGYMSNYIKFVVCDAFVKNCHHKIIIQESECDTKYILYNDDWTFEYINLCVSYANSVTYVMYKTTLYRGHLLTFSRADILSINLVQDFDSLFDTTVGEIHNMRENASGWPAGILKIIRNYVTSSTETHTESVI